MALPTINASDFNGFVNISADTYSSSDFADFISRGRINHIRRLLGDAAYVDIRDNTRAVYTALFAGADWVNDSGETKVSDSLTDVLLMLIYADFVPQQHIVNTNVGGVSNFSENSTGPLGMVQGSIAVQRSARAANHWENSICDFIEHYRKVTQEITSVDVTDPNNPVCTVSSASGNYLEDGDTVKILGVSYTAASVTATTFTVNAPGLGASFVNQEAIWEPLGKVQDTLPGIEVGFA